MQATRQQILDYIRRQGRATVKDLGTLLHLTPTGVRQHLTVLEREGLVTAHEERGRVGRPALVYKLTSKGDALYPKSYDQLSNVLLEEVRALAGAEALQTLLRRVASSFAAPYMDRLEGRPLSERVQEATAIIQERGCLAEASQEGDDWLIKQYTCPFPNVAGKNSCVCSLDVEFVRQLVGADARLTTSLLRGDDACTFRLRPVEVVAENKR
ncbi:MAG: winged helix-turn-helix transcriptional regulator [Chloroflexi bacterium]|nr:winged helix-turn-helix transcriptional regulator [Chloroflexota bacterium]MCI0856067.1 winged helix-turn-helix transcriptional regulator [Chloroflexota bacterium]MCI0889283.1 winged helix-turn-helix transcriptional regulator [Chloroflexota bacterium]